VRALSAWLSAAELQTPRQTLSILRVTLGQTREVPPEMGDRWMMTRRLSLRACRTLL
jgi:hypothetical protein